MGRKKNEILPYECTCYRTLFRWFFFFFFCMPQHPKGAYFFLLLSFCSFERGIHACNFFFLFECSNAQICILYTRVYNWFFTAAVVLVMKFISSHVNLCRYIDDLFSFYVKDVLYVFARFEVYLCYCCFYFTRGVRSENNVSNISNDLIFFWRFFSIYTVFSDFKKQISIVARFNILKINKN